MLKYLYCCTKQKTSGEKEKYMKLNKFDQYIYDNIAKLNKSQLLMFLTDMKKNVSKEVLCNTLKEKMLSGEQEIDYIYNQYKDIFSLKSIEVGEILNKNKSFIIWLKKQEIIGIDRYEEVYNYGRYLNVPYWNVKDVYNLIDGSNKLNELEEKLAKEKELIKKAGIKKQKETRKKNNDLRKEHEQQREEFFEKWQSINSGASAYLELAFWTMWMSRWAKVYTTKYKETNDMAYRFQADEYYENKLKAIKILVNSPYVVVSLYHPANADYINIDLCDLHKEEWQSGRRFLTSYSVRDYYKENEYEIEDCPHCFVDISKNYYSLFHIKIKVDGIEDKFSFHLPYSKGLDIFTDTDYPVEAGVLEGEGLFRFGRAVGGNEKIIYTESYVKKKFEKALQGNLS